MGNNIFAETTPADVYGGYLRALDVTQEQGKTISRKHGAYPVLVTGIRTIALLFYTGFRNINYPVAMCLFQPAGGNGQTQTLA